MMSNAMRTKVERARAIAQRRLRIDDEVTVAQLAELSGISKQRAGELLHELVASGEAVCVDPARPGKSPRRYTKPRAA